MGICRAALILLRALLIPKAHLVVENLALRQQLASYSFPGGGPTAGARLKIPVAGRSLGRFTDCFIAYRPWQCDVTEWIRPGPNTIQVAVIGTLKNTLGPHHAGAVRGFASPLGYGLFEPFVLRHAAR